MKDENLFRVMKSHEQGAATDVLAAVGKERESKGGKYQEDCEVAKRGVDDNETFGVGYVQQTYDLENERRLWKESPLLVGIGYSD
ncbi:short-chain dehydrogenase/reductase-like protein [Penicillium sp. IBT 16267x]|nr:short-chain dehydrogenase/reductase-like protein [Penicillium sp. IBT 16267x]